MHADHSCQCVRRLAHHSPSRSSRLRRRVRDRPAAQHRRSPQSRETEASDGDRNPAEEHPIPIHPLGSPRPPRSIQDKLLIAISESRKPRRNSARHSANAGLRDMPEAARALGLQMQVLNASTSREIEAAFATTARDRADALFVAPDAFFNSRRVQLATLAARDRIPTSCSGREMAEAGLLMSYGTDTRDMYRQVGTYTGQILNGAKPADLPVLQSTKFELVINLQTARALGIEVPNSIQLLADEVIE